MTTYMLRQLDSARQSGLAGLDAGWCAPVGATSEAQGTVVVFAERISPRGRDSWSDKIGAVDVMEGFTP